MKQTLRFIAVAFAIVATASCKKQETPSTLLQDNLVPVTLTASIDVTKADIQADGKVFWAEGDQIAVWVNDTKYTLTLSSGAGTKSATFSGLAAEGDVQGAVSPASAAGTDVKTFTPVLNQTIASGAVNDPAALIMTADAPSEGALSFKNAVGGARVTVTGDAQKVILKAAAGTIEVTVPGAGQYNILVPATSYAAFTLVTVYTDKYVFKSTDKTLEVAASKIYNVGDITASAVEVPFNITTADQMKGLAKYVDFFGASHAFTLGADIDFDGDEIIPIGDGSYGNSTSYKGRAFVSSFDGNNHTVDNFTITVGKSETLHVCCGLFGIVANGGSVKNVKIGENAVLDIRPKNMLRVGGVVGYLNNGTVENCSSAARITMESGTKDQRNIAGGVVGMVLSNNGSVSTLKNLKHTGSITSINTVQTTNGANSMHAGGICGFCDLVNGTGGKVVMENCVNEGTVSGAATRMAGILGTANAGTDIISCTNKGAVTCNDTKAANSRPAGIVSGAGGSAGPTNIKDCVNEGNITFNVAETAAASGSAVHGYVAGIFGQINNANTVVDGCINKGELRSDAFRYAARYMGVIGVHVNSNAATVKNCGVGGKIGPYTEDETYQMVTITADNFATYLLGVTGDAKNNKVVTSGNYYYSEE